MAVGLHTFGCEVERSEDEQAGRTARVICHGSLVNQTAGQLKDVVKPLIEDGGRIIVDLGDVHYVDSLGLGTLVGLMVSAVNKGYCTLEFEHLTQRVQELLRLTKLTELFKS